MRASIRFRRRVAALVAGFAAAALLFFPAPATADHLPADKIGVAASVMEVMKTQVGPGGGSSGSVELLRATLRNSTPTDLMVQVTEECALWTDMVVFGTDSSQAIASVVTWVEIDGQRVPVTHDANGDGTANDPDNGEVVFCNRDDKLSIAGFLPQQMVALFERTRSANAFNWAALNVGSGVHTVVVKARLSVQVSGTGTAAAGVGKRTLVVEPAKLANDATI